MNGWGIEFKRAVVYVHDNNPGLVIRAALIQGCLYISRCCNERGTMASAW